MFSAKLNYVRITPRKAMLVANLVRGRPVAEALSILRFSSRRRASGALAGVIASAVANAAQHGISPNGLVVSGLMVCPGPIIKRFRPRAQGRAFKINKRTCHLHVKLEERIG